MRVLKIFDGDYPWDIRVEKVVSSLLGAGHHVRLVCRNRKGLPRRETEPGGLEIVRLPHVPGLLSFPFFLSPLWLAAVNAEINSFRPDRLLVRDLPLAPLGIILGRRAGIPVVADLAEPYPDSLRSQWQFDKRGPLDLVIRNPVFADWVEKWTLRRIDWVLVVCPEAATRLEARGLPAGHWSEVGNTPVLEAFSPRGAAAPDIEGFERRFVLIFTGILAGDRGLDTALDAMAILRDRAPDRFGLAILGDGTARTALEAQRLSLGLERDVFMPGWIDHSRLPGYLDASQAGLLPFHACPHINSTLANKLFDYMALGLPVIAADVPPMRRVLEETGAGALFRSGDAEALADAIEGLADDPERQRHHAAAGHKAAAEKYNWAVEARRLVAAIEEPRNR